MTDGILLIDKPSGMTSFGVVARVRRRLSEAAGRKVKVGHTGTLDPFATGLMILVVGSACKNAAAYTKLDKVYEATIELGAVSSTGDPEGELTAVSTRRPAHSEVAAALSRFVGTITQTPPIYSAIKIDGQRAYKLARRGELPDIPRRTVHIYSLELLAYDYPNVRLRAHVGSGTYIRSLATDIGQVLGTGAYTTQLRRICIENYNISDAQQIEDV